MGDDLKAFGICKVYIDGPYRVEYNPDLREIVTFGYISVEQICEKQWDLPPNPDPGAVPFAKRTVSYLPNGQSSAAGIVLTRVDGFIPVSGKDDSSGDPGSWTSHRGTNPPSHAT